MSLRSRFHRLAAGVPLAAAVNVTSPPSQTAWLTGCVVTAGAILTVWKMSTGLLTQVLSVAVTVYFTTPLPISVCAIVPPELLEKPVTLPLDRDAIHEKLAPAGVLPSRMLVRLPLQIAAGEAGFTTGIGLTVIEN